MVWGLGLRVVVTIDEIHTIGLRDELILVSGKGCLV